MPTDNHHFSASVRNHHLTTVFHFARIQVFQREPISGDPYALSGYAVDQGAEELAQAIPPLRETKSAQLISALLSIATRLRGSVEVTDVKEKLGPTRADGGSPVKPGIPDADLFNEDTEEWIRKHMPYLSPEQIEEELQMIRMASLLEFYQSVVENYPELLEKLPRIPNILVARPNSPSPPLAP